MIHQGLQRLALINSGGYSRAEMPLDAACSLVAPNNRGKTSVINALQLVLVADFNRMNFGEHTREASRRFYFPSNSSYVLAQLQHADGEVVIGCVGKGHAHAYEYFAYKGALDLDDYRTEDGAIVAQPQLKAHMAVRGRAVHVYSPGEFSDGLYGRNRKRLEHEPNFNLFRLDHTAYTGVFQTVLARTLRLDRLTSGDVKGLLLEIFRHELTDAGVDFQAAWERAFAQVNADRAQFDAAQRQAGQVKALGQSLHELLGLRGKILAHRPVVDDLLRRWASDYSTRRGELQLELERTRAALDDAMRASSTLGGDRERLRAQIEALGAKSDRQTQLANALALVSDRAQLQARRQDVAAERDRQVTLIGNASDRPIDALEREIAGAAQALRQAQAALASADDNLHRHLRDALGEDVGATVARLAHPGALTLPPQAFAIDATVLRAAAGQAVAGTRLRLPGLEIDTNALPAAPGLRSREQLGMDLAEAQDRHARLETQLQTAQALEAARRRRDELEDQLRTIEQQLSDFDELAVLQAASVDRERELQEALGRASELDRRVARMAEDINELRAREVATGASISALDADDREVERLRQGRRDTGPAFDHLESSPHHLWVGAVSIRLDELRAALGSYLDDCQQLGTLTQALRAGVSEQHAAGLTKFVGSPGMEAEITHMVNFVEALPHEAETLERAARQAVVEVSSTLVDLRRSLEEMTSRMRDFNKLISQRRLSDLEVFKLELVELPELVGAIDKLLATAQLADSGESFALFNHGGQIGDDEIDRAKALLIAEGQHHGGLRLEHLFRLEFRVGKRGQAVESFQDLEESASLGTILMAKLVIGLAMLHLMRDKRSPSQAVCYLDEAATLDPVNQRSLIDTAREFGFSLVLASPLPLTTARYCVPIDTVAGRNVISRQRWQVIEPLEAESAAG